MIGGLPIARKRTKKQAKARIPRLPTLPPSVVPLLGPLAPPYILGKSAEIVADSLIDMDPLNRLAAVVNDPAIVIDTPMANAINDPLVIMTGNGQLARLEGRSSVPSGFQVARKKRKKNPKLKKALQEANRRLRLKNGKLRKGKTQGDIMRLAHRLMKKMR